MFIACMSVMCDGGRSWAVAGRNGGHGRFDLFGSVRDFWPGVRKMCRASRDGGLETHR